MAQRLTDNERHYLWLIDRGLLTAPGSDRDPTVISLRERGLIMWSGLMGFWLTKEGREALERRYD